MFFARISLIIFYAAALSAAEVTFRVQPISLSVVKINGEKAAVKLLSRDNELGLVKITFKQSFPLKFDVEAKGFRTFTLEAAKAEDLKDRFIMLDREGSRHRFLKVLPTGEAPKSVTFLDNKRISVPLLNGRGTDVIDIDTGKVTLVEPPEKYAKKTGFVESLVLPQFDELWISQMTASVIHCFSLSTLKYKDTVQLTGNWAKIMVYDGIRDVIYVSNWGTNDISVVDHKKRKELKRIKAGGTPRGTQISDDGNFLFVAQFGGTAAGGNKGHLVKIDLKTGKTVARLGVAGAKRHIVRDDKRGLFYTSDMAKGLVEAFDRKKETQVGSVKVFYNPNTIYYAPASDLLYVSSRGQNHPKGYAYKGLHFGRIQVIDPQSFKIIEFWEGGNQPTGLDVSADGKLIIFSDFLDRRIRVYEYKGSGTE